MLIFQNTGLIDINAAITLGVSVKDGDSPIGFFGTGLKFSIATILRNGGSITIWSGLDEYRFESEQVVIRGEPFEMVTMNGDRLGFTTQLGRNWKPWMAFRELASNAKDEGGKYWHTSSGESVPRVHSTTIMVEGIDDVWPEHDTILLESQPIYADEKIEIHDGTSPYLFYRGVRVCTPPAPTAFTYNVLSPLTLTEDRTVPWIYGELAIEKGLGACTDRHILRRSMTCGRLWQDHTFNVPKFGEPGPVFNEVCRELTLGAEKIENINPAAASHARLSAIKDMKPGDGLKLSHMQNRMLDKAKAMLIAGGFDFSAFDLICVETLGPSICGTAKDGKIYISEMAFEKGTRELAATLFEEYAHLKSGQDDCTRGFQNWLIDRLLIKVEQIAGEPF